VEGEGTENTKEDQEEAEETIAEEEEPNYEDQHQHGPYLHQVQNIKLILLIGWEIGPTFVTVTGEWTLVIMRHVHQM